jgi:phenylpropionate dioxygenase-like ring-hydroxylating dioxygenase large terminal subunit
MTQIMLEPSVLHEWHVLGALEEMPVARPVRTHLLGVPVLAVQTPDGVSVWRVSDTSQDDPLPVRVRYGYVWTSLGSPAHELFELPEYGEPDRRLGHAGTFAVHTSAPRVIENFLDMAHFPFVHGGYLGVEPYTEVQDYDVSVSADRREVVARRCRFFQPMASLVAKEGFEVEYVYRVPHPYCAVLYKSSALHPDRQDLIALVTRPLDEEHTSASLFQAMLDEQHSDVAIRQFQQLIFAQDKPILENQRPRRLPLDPRQEISVRADRMSAAYRRWLLDSGIRYGTLAPDESLS